jgi:hypothetical protein
MSAQNYNLLSAAGGFDTRTPYLVAASTLLYTGAVMTLSGYLVPAADTTGGRFVGLNVDGPVDNSSGSAGALSCYVQNRLACGFIAYNAVSPAQSWVGTKVYFTNNGTVATSSTNSISAGYVVRIIQTGTTGIVLVDPSELD